MQEVRGGEKLVRLATACRIFRAEPVSTCLGCCQPYAMRRDGILATFPGKCVTKTTCVRLPTNNPVLKATHLKHSTPFVESADRMNTSKQFAEWAAKCRARRVSSDCSRGPARPAR